MSIATRTGDDGTTSLLYGRRVPKDHPRVSAYGTVDELSAGLGLARATAPDPATARLLHDIQKALIPLMGELATDAADHPRFMASKMPHLLPEDLGHLDTALAAIEAQGLTFEGWTQPGASLHDAHLHHARTLCRRAEREIAQLLRQEYPVRPLLPQYLNRLSDLLWLLAYVESRRMAPQSGEGP